MTKAELFAEIRLLLAENRAAWKAEEADHWKVAMSGVERGLFEADSATELDRAGFRPGEINAIFARVTEKRLIERWKQGGFPESVTNNGWLFVRAAAIEWMDAEAPNHFARAILRPGEPIRLGR